MSSLIKKLMNVNLFEPEYASILLQHDVTAIMDKESKTQQMAYLHNSRFRISRLKRIDLFSPGRYTENLIYYEKLLPTHHANIRKRLLQH